MDTERQSIIKELGNWFGDLSQEFPDDKVFAVVIRGMITRLKQGEIPERKQKRLANAPLSKIELDKRRVIGKLIELRGYRLLKKNGVEAQSIINMLKHNFTAEQIIDTWKTMKADKFWSGKELHMMSVESQIGAIVNKNKVLKNDPEKYFKGRLGHLVQR